MSTSRSALQLLREEPLLVGVVLQLVASGDLQLAGVRSGIPVSLFAKFSGMTEAEVLLAAQEGRGPQTFWETSRGWVIPLVDLRRWLRELPSDRSDFAPAVPRALPGGRA